MSSIYRWRGEVEKAEEILLVMKTSEERFEALREVIALPVAAGHAPYLAWLEDSVGK